MSEATPEKEIEVVAGVIGGITQKKEDTWVVAVTVEGLSNPKNLWTKDAELVKALQSKFGQAGAFVCSASYWQHPQHGQVRSLWINSEAASDAVPGVSGVAGPPVPAQTRATPATAPKAEGSEGMSKEEWARKDRAADLRACIAIAAGALQHTVKSEPSDADLNEFARRTLFVARQFHGVVTGERAGGEDVPFLSEHDQQIPY